MYIIIFPVQLSFTQDYQTMNIKDRERETLVLHKKKINKKENTPDGLYPALK